MTKVRVAAVRDGVVVGIVVFTEWADELSFARDIIALSSIGPYAGCAAYLLRADESASIGDVRGEDGTFAPPAPQITEQLVTLDTQTASVMISGYKYQGITLSTSPTAQTRWTALYTARNSVSYPLLVFSVDNSSSIEITSADQVAEVFIGMVNALTLEHQAGARAKATIQ